MVIPDVRTIKVKSKNSLIDYLQIALWFDEGSETRLLVTWAESRHNKNLQYIDYIAKIVADKFEDKKNTLFDQLKPHIIHRKLFF